MGELDLEAIERRSESRFDIGNEVALVDLLDGREPIKCCVWNLSASGVCLFVPPDFVVPARFKVMLGNNSFTAVQVWRDRLHIGVKFID